MDTTSEIRDTIKKLKGVANGLRNGSITADDAAVRLLSQAKKLEVLLRNRG